MEEFENRYNTNLTQKIRMPRIIKNNILHAEISYKLNGIFFKIHNELGRFRNEKQYADALEYKLNLNNINYQREKALPESFSGENKNRNIPDFIVEDKIIIDIKAKRLITKSDYFQMKRYLVSSGKNLGIIVNFRQRFLTPKRIVN